MAICNKCGFDKPARDFYSSRPRRCKSCVIEQVKQNRLRNLEYYRACDRARGNRQTADGVRRYRERNREKYLAHNAANNAIRDGKLARAPCMICGREDVHAHHDNYARPLDVVWLCPPHHFERHKAF